MSDQGSNDEHGISRRVFLGSAAVVGAALAQSQAAAAVLDGRLSAAGPRRESSFDDDWRFIRADVPGAETPTYDDASWTPVTLPYDWSIEDLPRAPKTTAPWVAPAATWNESPSEKSDPLASAVLPPWRPNQAPIRVGPFDAAASGGAANTGWLVGGTAWYRKRFSTPRLKPNERVELRIDASFQETEVWLNGASLGTNVYGYGAFTFDLTDQLRPYGENIMAVRTSNEGETSRWYSGSGIYRHTWLTVTGPVRIAPWGLWAYTPRIDKHLANAVVEVEIDNALPAEKRIEVKVVLRDSAGGIVVDGGANLTLAARASGKATVKLDVPQPQLWSPESPALYEADVVVTCDGKATDRTTTRFGIRSIAASAERGLTINGVPIKLKGACLHADNGILGANAIDRAEVRKVEVMKSFGYNALRMGHQMFSPAFMEACDANGMLLISEVFDAWEKPKWLKNDYSRLFAENWKTDIARMVRQNRNHPSVIFWSIGNEIPEAPEPRGIEIAARLRQAVLELDSSRLITAAIPIPIVFGDAGERARRSLDVAGYNYGQESYESDHKDYPRVIMMGTEQWSREIYEGWRKVETDPWVLGEFVWSGIDYIGEVGSGSSELRKIRDDVPRPAYVASLSEYPAYLSGCGEVDINGRRKPQGLYRDVLWGRSPLELLVQRPTPPGTYERVSDWGWHDELESWTWPQPDGHPMIVRTYTSGDMVKLILNGQVIAEKSLTSQDKLKAEFDVPYVHGSMVAVAYKNGAEIGRKTLETVGPPAKLRLRLERSRITASPNDLGYVFVEVCDAQGRKTPDATLPVTVSVAGVARLRATGSANPRGLKSFRSPECATFHGEALAIVQPFGPSGECLISVTAPGLAGDKVSLMVG